VIAVVPDTPFDARAVAARLVAARRRATPLAAYPGPLPRDLEQAYRCQDAAIACWGDVIAGWKVGWVAEPYAGRYGEQRLVGPIFAASVRHAQPAAVNELPVYAGGFAAIEAEYIFRLAADAPAAVTDWSPEQAAALVANLYVGIEVASSPLASINELGAAVIASDFGNNAGLLIGPEIPDWRQALSTAACEAFIDGHSVGRGGAANISGGPLAGLAFALRRNALRGRPLRAGDLVTTGAATGVHDIRVGQQARVSFSPGGEIACRIVAMQPQADAGGSVNA
jgi:2-keto-4-pentenoate hydratase